jgi:CDP-glycerol glycerophosphotransferase (TagB/SpsB family)
LSQRLKDLLRRIIDRARVSPSPVTRWGIDFARTSFRGLAWLLPGLHLGWMSNLRHVGWDGDDLILRGWSFVRGTEHGGSPRHDVYLRAARRPVWLGGRLARAEVHHVPNPDVMSSLRAELRYDGSTWEARFPAAQLAGLPAGRWGLHARVVGGHRRSWGPVRNSYPFGTPATAMARRVGDRLIRPLIVADGGGTFVESKPLGIPAASVDATGRDVTIVLSGDLSRRLGRPVLRGPSKAEVAFQTRPEGDQILLTATVPTGKTVVDARTGIRRPPRWTAMAESGEPITLLTDSAGHRPNAASRLLVGPSPSRAVEIVDVPHFVEVDAAERDGDVIRLTGSVAGEVDEFDLVLAAARAEIPVTFESIDAAGRFVATAPLAVRRWGGPALPPMRGGYVLEGRLRGRSGNAARFATFVSEAYLSTVPSIDAQADMRLRFEVNGQPQLLVRVARPRATDEYGAFNQVQLFNAYALGDAAVADAGPLDAVCFESFFGRSATCNPRAIDAEIARQRPDLPRYWSVDDLSVAVPDGAIPLVIGTRDWWRVRESARWIVTNEWLRGRYVKKPFQTVLQTWHGSMYKRIGMDRGGGGQTDRARAERANWDMFISQNGDTTPIIQQAYEFEGASASAVLEIGYPRNDELTRIAPERVEAIRQLIGVPEGDRVVMYAPTWREAGQQVELLDLISLAKAVGPGYTFLQRAHVRTLEEGESIGSKAVIDVSTHPQINDLFLASDLLITDYSSMMFDYSVTGRPMLFYTPDIEEYTDPKVRGAYFDLEELAPGPVVRTVPEVVELLGSIDDWVPSFAARYDAWRRRFNHLDDGNASARAVDALFGFDPSARDNGVRRRRRFEPAAGEEA